MRRVRVVWGVPDALPPRAEVMREPSPLLQPHKRLLGRGGAGAVRRGARGWRRSERCLARRTRHTGRRG